MKAFQQNKNVPLLEQWLIEQWDILGALLLAVVLCLALDLLKCNWVKLAFWPKCSLFRPVLVGFGRKKLDKTGFIQFFPFCSEETGFGWKKPNPGPGRRRRVHGLERHADVYLLAAARSQTQKMSLEFKIELKIINCNLCSFNIPWPGLGSNTFYQIQIQIQKFGFFKYKYKYKYFTQVWFKYKYKYIDSNTNTNTFNQIYLPKTVRIQYRAIL